MRAVWGARAWLVPVAGLTVGLAVAVPLCGGGTSARPVKATYTGGVQLKGLATLRASASSRGARVVAVSFFLGGKPVGSDTTPPYAVDFPAALWRKGKHQLKVVAVDSQGRRKASRPVQVETGGRLKRALTASPDRGLRRALRALEAGGATVRLLPGNYVLEGVSLGSGSRLIGSGPSTVISAPSGSYWAILVARGRHVRVSDLTVDGGGSGESEGHAIEIASGAADVRLSRLKIKRVRGVGIYASGDYRDVSIQDSSIGGSPGASVGVLAGDGSRDASVIRTRIRGFRDWGINFVHVPTGDTDAAPRALALDNSVSGINDPNKADGTNEGAIWSGGTKAAIIGNVIRSTGWDGIETVGSSLGVSVVGNDIAKTPVGIYIEHSTNRSLFMANRIANVESGINVEWRYGGVGSNGNRFLRNEIVNARRGVFIDVGEDGNLVEGNTFVDVEAPITLQGSSRNTVRNNRACGAAAALVSEAVGLWDDQTQAVPSGNALAKNTFLPCSRLK